MLAALTAFSVNAFSDAAYEPLKATVSVEIKHGGTAVIIPQVNCPIPEETVLKVSDGKIGRFYIQFTEPGTYTYTVRLKPEKRDNSQDKTVYTVYFFITDEDGRLTAVTTIFKDGEKYAGDKDNNGISDILMFINPPPEIIVVPTTAAPVPDEETTTEPHGIPPVVPVVPAVPVVPVVPVIPDTPDNINIPINPEIITLPDDITIPSLPEVPTSPDDQTVPTGPEVTTSPDEGTTIPDENNRPSEPDKGNPKTSDDSKMEIYFLVAMIASAGLLGLSVIYAIDCSKIIKNTKGNS